jgi:hypothetical protein
LLCNGRTHPSNVRFGISIRLKSGGSTVIIIDEWFRHEDADVNIAEYTAIDSDHRILVEQINDFVLKGELERLDIGLGDDLVFPGLFEFVDKQQPIVRFGTLAVSQRSKSLWKSVAGKFT